MTSNHIRSVTAAVLIAATLAGGIAPAYAQPSPQCEVRERAYRQWQGLMRDWNRKFPMCAEGNTCGECADAYELFWEIDDWLDTHTRCKNLMPGHDDLRQAFVNLGRSCGFPAHD